MRKLLTILLISITTTAVAQKAIGVEQSVYYSKQANLTLVPVISLQSKKNWYAETRLNYEDVRTASVHVGKTFGGGAALAYSVTPLAGALVGNTNGLSLGSNIELEYKGWNWFTQTQYVFAAEDFVYTWSELFYAPVRWAYAGVALQHTAISGEQHLFEPGVGVGVSVKNLSLTLYDFVALPSKQHTFVISLIFQKN